MPKPSRDPSVHAEPHRRDDGFRPDPSERRAERALRRAGKPSTDERVDHSVWDEPGLTPELAGPTPDDALTYERWFERRHVETGLVKSWSVTLAIALAAGPWAVLGAFWGSGATLFSVVAMVAVGPVVEEMMKVAVGLWVVERKPYLFLTSTQVMLCALCGGLVFAAIENVLYLHVYIPNPSDWLVRWRWTVCVALHVGCSAIAGMGIMRMWRDGMKRRARPRLSLAFPYLTLAAIIHGTYNAFAIVLSISLRRM
ncbi:PrsW family intramembrane metalloprotease [bacterium]|nr:PrsW family intramembrane metalloprotease [bacterium]